MAHDYLKTVLRRGRESRGSAGHPHGPVDRPGTYKVYPGATRIPLPEPGRSPLRGPVFTVEFLSAMLRDSYGLTSRRLRVDANGTGDTQPWHQFSVWGRGAPSGGGLYPLEIYWAVGTGGPVSPGVYHYSPPHHALHRLLAGNVTARVAAALGPDPQVAGDHHQYLIVAVRFWKNAVKYGDLCYHLVTMDLGALLGTWATWARGAGVRLRPRLWFDDAALNGLLGLEPMRESAMAVVPVPWEPTTATPERRPAGRAGSPRPAPAVSRPDRERSRRVVRSTLTEQVHAATMTAGRLDLTALADAAPPAGSSTTPSSPAAAAVPLPLPDISVLQGDQRHLLASRRSAFGLLAGQPGLSRRDLGTVLAAGSRAGLLRSDATDPDEWPDLTRLGVFVNHVADVPAGTYRFDRSRHRLELVVREPPGPFLQRSFLLSNYNVEQAAVVVAVQARPAAVIRAVGARGFRLVNAVAGAVSQAVYLASAALGLGCGAVLGFDNAALAEKLGLAGTDEWPLLLMLVGHPPPDIAEIDGRFEWRPPFRKVSPTCLT